MKNVINWFEIYTSDFDGLRQSGSNKGNTHRGIKNRIKDNNENHNQH